MCPPLRMRETRETSELTSRGIKDYSELGFGESLSKIARHKIALLCIQAIRDELDHNPMRGKGRGRGRPASPMGLLAVKMGVHPDSVKRWMNLKEIQASDYNAERLAEMAYAFDPAGLTQILQEDIARRRETMDSWLRQADSKYRASPYDVNSKPCPYCADSFASERDLRTHIISFHGERPISLARRGIT